MAWTKTSAWTDLIGASGAHTILDAGGASSGSAILDGTNDYIMMATMVYYNASTAASDLTIKWLGWSHQGASLVDTESMLEVLLVGTNSASVKATYQLDVSALDGISVNVTNNEDTDGASVHVAAMFGYA